MRTHAESVPYIHAVDSTFDNPIIRTECGEARCESKIGVARSQYAYG